ncbi:hypothetical protein [Paenibacillus sp. N3.4]|uniref:hypothetical protein n=1 Tax=Paenibacillus sp. N3.4 TaxID=2603222 RepID=UPI0011C86A7E|nr:hypothetical protein [Paenibacillus sp. N3.4]TXK83560.1 hypothetical protein FU659_13380 [Paenibacillus sp. N3.4]
MKIVEENNNFTGSIFAKFSGIVAKVAYKRVTNGYIDFADVTGDLVESVVENFIEFVLNKRAKERISSSFKNAAEKIIKLKEEGYIERTDISIDEQSYTVKDELIEDLFKKVMNQHQEKKIKYITNAAVSFFYEKGTEKHTSEFVFNAMKIADNLTFQQMCLLMLFSTDKYRNSLRAEEHEGKYEYSDAQYNVYNEILELVRLGLLCCATDEAIDNWNNMDHWDVDQVHTIDDIIPHRMVPTYFGSSFNFLLGLHDISDDEIKKVITNGDLTTILFE